MNEVRLVEVYPQLLGTYGDRGNAIALRHRALARGYRVDSHVVGPGEPVPLHGDVYLVGGGEDTAQALAASLLRADGGLARAVALGRSVVAVCAGLQILGNTFAGPDGSALPGLGLVDAETVALARRASGPLVTKAELDGASLELVGFENHGFGTRLGRGCRPLGRVERGTGNFEADGVDGLVQGSIVATYLHGPLLALNPRLADLLLQRVVGPLAEIDPAADAWAEAARAARRSAR
jgi:CobQ-like glutamine amidotransferase family enzyme